MTRSYLRSTRSVVTLTRREETAMKVKLFKVASVLMVLAASGLADFPLGFLGHPKCC